MDRRDFIKGAVTTGAAAAMGALGGRASEAQTSRRRKVSEYRKAVTLSMLPGDKSMLERFQLARDTGFHGIEIGPITDQKEIDEVKAASEKTNVAAHSIIFGGWGAPLSHPDAAVADQGLAQLEGALRLAKQVGADGVLLVPAVVNKEVAYQDAYSRSQSRIRKVIPLAADLKVKINIEEVWNKFLLSPMEFARYIDELGSPWVQAYFDVANVIDFGWPEHWIRTLGKRIAKVHLKDFKRDGRQWVGLGEGDADFPTLMQAFAEVGYSGWLTCELPGGDKDYLRDVSRRVDDIIAGKDPAP